ncbi:hypothetical protein, partial [Chromobacterium haemolyticum]|uniref:hypothetical protein n=1 Tax=Chromobacterium haemolyticum TaxID=394935 RepID=UPI001EE685DD
GIRTLGTLARTPDFESDCFVVIVFKSMTCAFCHPASCGTLRHSTAQYSWDAAQIRHIGISMSKNVRHKFGTLQ